ncbi:MAG: hypothetical protein DI556_05965 [Rhodovulum sulfidophilum]|uniref:Uncharacterized protein n=1 Tax=Rhodovulum sulfidophilum TaxID=35806 RepID=A0A2W5NC48_RHOSU|nr:MAG: hypothetical protein DI556_05965 [Rhodovulum sulfidophilum]
MARAPRFGTPDAVTVELAAAGGAARAYSLTGAAEEADRAVYSIRVGGSLREDGAPGRASS